MVLRKQCQVVVELLTRLGITTRIVETASASWSLVPTVVSHVGLSADDRFDTAISAFFIKFECSVHIAVIGNSDRWLTVCNGGRNEFVEPRCPIEHRKFCVDVEVGE